MRHLLALLLVIASSSILADEPAALYMFPAGGQRGTNVDVRVGAMCVHEGCPLHMTGVGITASPRIQVMEKIWFEGPVIPLPDSQRNENYPQDYQAQIKIAADAPPGTRWWRLSNSQGVTSAMRFVVGDLPEIVEQEIDGEPIPVEVKLPVTINGRAFPREDIDVWSFTAKKGETIRCEVTAARLGSLLDSQLEIVDSTGRRVAVNGDYYGADSLIVFTAPTDGVYQARIHDAAFGGLQPYVYRLTISAEPHVLSFYPLGGRRGATSSLAVTGVNVGSAPMSVSIPKDAPADWPTTLAVGSKRTNPVLLETSDSDELLEREPNQEASQAMKLTIPCIANGKIDTAGDRDCWLLDAKKGDAFSLDVRAGRLGSPLDPVLVVLGADGKEVARSDDISGTDSDAQLQFAPAADGVFTVIVSERHASRGGLDFAYRLHVTAGGDPDFRLTLPADALTLYRDGQARLRVAAQRLGVFNETIQLVVDNLPEGVTVSNDKINKGAPQTDLVLKAPADAKIDLREIVVRGVAKWGDKEITRLATFPVERGEPPLDKLTLAVSIPTPFKVVSEFQLPYAPRGTVFRRHYRLERNGFDGPLEIILADKQARHLQGVTGSTITVPAGVDEFDYLATMAPWMELGRTSRTLVTAVGLVDDGQGHKHKVCFTSPHQNEQVSVIIAPCPLGVEVIDTTIAKDVQRPCELGVSVDRAPGLNGPVRIELIVPRHIRGVSAEPIVVPADTQQGRLVVRFQADAGPFNMPLTVRASTGEGERRVVAETKVEVVE